MKHYGKCYISYNQDNVVSSIQSLCSDNELVQRTFVALTDWLIPYMTFSNNQFFPICILNNNKKSIDALASKGVQARNVASENELVDI
jgi:hypothetical protein